MQVDEGSAPKSNILHRDNTETRGPSIELLQVDDRLPSSSCQPCSGPRVLSNEQPLPVASSTIACVDEMSMMSPVLSNCTDAGAQSMQQPVARGLSPHSAAIDDLTPAPSGNPVLIRHSASTKTAPYPSPSLFISQRPESSGSPCQAVRNQYHPSQADSTLYYPAQLLNSTLLTSHQIAPFWQADLLRGHCPTTNTNDLFPVNAPCLTSVFPGYPAHRDICFKTQPRFPSTNRQGWLILSGVFRECGVMLDCSVGIELVLAKNSLLDCFPIYDSSGIRRGLRVLRKIVINLCEQFGRRQYEHGSATQHDAQYHLFTAAVPANCLLAWPEGKICRRTFPTKLLYVHSGSSVNICSAATKFLSSVSETQHTTKARNTVGATIYS